MRERCLQRVPAETGAFDPGRKLGHAAERRELAELFRRCLRAAGDDAVHLLEQLFDLRARGDDLRRLLGLAAQTRDAGLATVVYGPGGKWIAHQADEFVEISDVATCARVYAGAALRFLTAARGRSAA